MDDSPIAGEETALVRRDDFSEGRDAVLQRHGVTAFVRSGHSNSTAFDHSPLVAASAYALDPYLNIGLPTLYDEPKLLCRPSGHRVHGVGQQQRGSGRLDGDRHVAET
jgi:hypothetical protein